MIDAMVQKGALYDIPVGKGVTLSAAFMGYAYTVCGSRYAGLFAVCGDDQRVRELYEILPSHKIRIRCNPANPNVSFLADNGDALFGGLRATQNPDRLSYCPSFDLQDTLRSR